MAVSGQVRASKRRSPSGATGQDDDDAQRLRAVVARVEEETMLWQSFLRAHRTIVEELAAQMLRDHNLPLEWFDILIHLSDVPDGTLRQRVLRDRLLLSESGVSRLLLRMATAGLITRSPADDDRRGMAITMTPKGRSAILAATESHLELVSALFTDRLTTTDRSSLSRILPKLSATESVAPATRKKA
ncbi:MAG TPA: MarR family winged helix-turn-helix transcriptional regulator [Mycobacterium sp.]|jgi:DNA-binding MarR family transcriptional regulator|nr:MarR family winged helix-turn-helix transcriptional regulator [Mycobacterium sp.]